MDTRRSPAYQGRGRGTRGRGTSIQHQQNNKTPTHPSAHLSPSQNPSSRQQPPRQRKTDGDEMNRIRMQIRKGSFRHQHDVRKFVATALDTEDQEDLLLLLADQGGLTLLQQIAAEAVSIDAGQSRAPLSFQRVALPLLAYLANLPDVFSGKRRKIYGVFLQGERDFFPNLLACMDALTQLGSMNDRNYRPERDDGIPWDLPHWTEPILLLLKFLSKSLLWEADAQSDKRYPHWLRKIIDMKNRWEQRDSVTDRETALAKREIERHIQNIESSILPPEEAKEKAKMMSGAQRSFTTFLASGSIHEDGHGPGVLHPKGPRHSNDHANFREIQIIPTMDEIFAEESPYLPKPGRNNFIPPGVDRYLDSQFRLLREDLLTSIRRGISGFVSEGKNAFTALGASGNYYQLKESGIGIVVFRRLKVESLSTDPKKGITLDVSFDQPTRGVGDSKYWSTGAGGKNLQHGSLVILWFGAKSDIRMNVRPLERKIFIAVVAERGKLEPLKKGQSREPGSKGRPMIGVQLLENELLRTASEYLGQLVQDDEHVMVQVRGHFFTAGHAVLSTLQKFTPLSMPFANTLVRQELSSGPPQYVEPERTVYNLKSLLKKNSMPGLEKVSIADFQSLRRTLLARKDDLALDETQISAVAAALTREISLIQGPPGCGKTYVGVRIVQILLENISSQISNTTRTRMLHAAGIGHNASLPILAVCYTNHALDQFLTDLIDSGVDKTNVVRVGGRSKDESLSTRNLRELTYSAKTRDEISRSKAIEEILHGLGQKIKNFVNYLHLPAHQWQLFQLEGTLEILFPEHYEELKKNDSTLDPWGSTKIGKKAKKMDLLQLWVNGIDINVRDSRRRMLIRNLEANRTKKSHRIEDSNPFVALGTNSESDGGSQSDEDSDDGDGDSQLQPADIDTGDRDRALYDLECEVEALNIGMNEQSDRPLPALLQDSSVWKMSRRERLKLVNHWISEYIETSSNEFERRCKSYEALKEDYNDLYASAQLRVLRGAKIVGMTTTGAATHMRILRTLSPAIVICEEAGEVLESHIISSLTEGSQHLILIGDHQQLRPKVEEFELSMDSNSGYDLDLSLFERLVRLHGDRGGVANDGSLITLETQRRMRPAIADLIRRTLYPRLKDSPTVTSYPDVRGMSENLWFFDHNNYEMGGDEGSAKSKVNVFEAEMVLALTRHLIKQGYQPGQIAVLTPYAGQLLKIRSLFRENRLALYIDARSLNDASKITNAEDDEGTDGESENEEGGDDAVSEKPMERSSAKSGVLQNLRIQDRVRLATVDNFQGEEAEVVVISTVRCNSNRRAGFLKISNRVNVMMSRAKHGMYVFGSSETVGAHKEQTFSKMLDIFAEKGLIGKYLPLRCERHRNDVMKPESPKDFRNMSPDGGCERDCGFKLDCGHVCPRACHPDDVKHRGYECKERCQHLLDCGHPCPLLCYQKCGRCFERIDIKLPCGHTYRNAFCYQLSEIEEIKCKERVSAVMPHCGHMQKMTCYDAHKLDSTFKGNDVKQIAMTTNGQKLISKCSKPCEGIHGCGHPCLSTCGQCSVAMYSSGKSHAKECEQKCDRMLLCGHRCAGVQCHPSNACPPCNQPCESKCQHSSCDRQCSEPCAACAMPCLWSCPHGTGRCLMACGSPCLKLPCDHRCEKKLKCGCRCPSTCGEPCPDPAVACPKCAKDLTTVVDMILFVSLGDYDLEEGPLIALSCGHCFTIETLDNVVDLKSYYKKGADEVWEQPLPLPTENRAIPTCPHCRKAIHGVRRYGRVLNHAFVDQTTRKHELYIEQRSKEIQTGGLAIGTQMDDLVEKVQNAKDQRVVKSLNPEIIAVNKFIKQVADQVRIVGNEVKRHPLREIYDKSVSALHRANPKDRNIVEKQIEFLRENRLIPPPRARIDAGQCLLRIECLRARHTCILLFIAAKSSPTRPGPDAFRQLHHTQLNGCNELKKRVNTMRKEYNLLEKLCEISQSRTSLAETRTIYLQCAYMYLDSVIWLERTNPLSLPMEFRTQLGKDEVLEDMKSIANKCIETARTSVDPKSFERRDAAVKVLEAAERLCRDTFYQEVSREEKKAIVEAMGADVGTGVGSFGGHWYTCPNGHVYTIGECGGATQTSLCPECGETVGGERHQLDPRNRPAMEFLREVNSITS